jgi:hypothetical protein
MLPQVLTIFEAARLSHLSVLVEPGIGLLNVIVEPASAQTRAEVPTDFDIPNCWYWAIGTVGMVPPPEITKEGLTKYR